MKKMRTLCGTILVAVAALAANGGEAEQKTAVFAGATQGEGVIRLGGNYAGHLQDVWRDGNVLYWAHTLALVKTDLSGNVLAKADVNEHHAGLEVRDGIWVGATWREPGVKGWVSSLNRVDTPPGF